MIRLLAIFLLLSSISAFSQVEIAKDHRLDLLIAKQEELNKKVYFDNNRTASGFRILVMNTNDRKKAMDVKSTLMRDFPDHKVYLIYQSPYFKIQIGNFRKREEAESLRKQVTRLYPTGVIVIPSAIEIRPEDDPFLNN
jgi:SPOR domain